MPGDINTVISATDNVSAIVKKISGNINTLSNNFEDLSGALQDLSKYQRAYAESTGATVKAGSAASKSVQDLTKGVTTLSSSLKQTGPEFASAINSMDVTEITQQFSKLSATDISSLSTKLREVGGSISGLLSGKKIDLNLGPAVAELNELQKLLGKPLSPATDFSSAEGAFKEMRTLNSSFREEVGETFKLLTDPSINGQIARALTPFGELESTLKSIQTGASSEGLDKILNFEQATSSSEQLLVSVEEMRAKLVQLSPAAKQGIKPAVQEFVELSAKISKAEQDAESLAKQLRDGEMQFKQQTGGQNNKLQEMGFRKIKLDDIFPGSEQQKVAQLQNKINNAVRTSINEGAVKKTLNLFLAQDRQIKSVDKNIVSLTSHLPRLRYAMYDVSNSAGIFGAAVMAAVVSTVKVSADFERAFADVKRTVGDSTEAMRDLRTELVQISKDIPVSFKDLSEIATLAGQLNIAKDVVDEFTETVAKFSATTDVSIDSAATAFGRLDQLVDGVNGQFDKLGSSILKVGVNAVATESDIIAISAQIASVANIAGFSAAELVGFSSAMASVGTRPELARGTFTRLFTEIQQAVEAGGDQLDGFANVANQSSDEFAKAWGEGSGPEQIIAILEGLNAAGQGADGVLRELGITSVRDVPTLLKLAQSVESVKDQMNFATIGFNEGTELTTQYSIITATLSEKLVVLKNNFDAFIASLGSTTGLLGGLVTGLSKTLGVLEMITNTKVGGFVAGVIAIIFALIGVMALATSGIARMGASLFGGVTAMTELYGTTALARLQIAQLGTVTESLALSTQKAATIRRGLTLDQAKGNLVQARANIAMQRGTVSAVRYNASLGVMKARLQIAGATISATASRLKLFSIVAQNAARNTRLFTTTLKTLAKLKGIAIFLAISAGLEFVVGQMSKANKEAKDLSERFDDWGAILEAVKQDSRDFANATAETAGQFTVVGKAVPIVGEEVSNYSRTLAVANGEQAALTSLLDSSSDAYDRQAIAIGKNTRALMAQKLAKEVAAAAEAPQGFFQEVGFGLSAAFRGDSPGELIQDARETAALDALISTFGTELGASLQEAGFSYKQWSDAIISGNTEIANSIAGKLSPAAKKLADSLEESSPEKYAEEIETLRTIAGDGTGALLDFASSNDQVTEAVRQAKIEIEAQGGAFSEAEEEVEEFRKAMNTLLDSFYAQVNAEKASTDSIIALGEAFHTQGAAIVADGAEMQSAISGIMNAAESNEDALDGLNGFYSALIEGGYVSAEQLVILEDLIISTYRTATALQITELKKLRDALEISKAVAMANGRFAAAASRAYSTDANVIDYNERIAALQKSMDSIDSIGVNTENSAEAANLLAKGYRDAEDAAKDTASAAGDVADETEDATKSIRTLMDYASDLEGIFDRAFDLRFGRQNSIDTISEAWQKFAEQVNEARMALEELQATQEDLGADRSIKEYFLSVAEAYGDVLRAATLRNEIAELDRQQAENQKALAEATATTLGANSLGGDSTQGRANRQELLGMVKSYQEYIGVLASTGASQSELSAATALARSQFEQQAREMGFQEADIQMYAQAFDDVTFAINNIPRNITVDANTNPAIQALNELNAKLEQSTDKARELNRTLGSGPTGSGGDDPKTLRGDKIRAEIAELKKRVSDPRGGTVGRGALGRKIQNLEEQLRLGNYTSGGFTGRGGKFDPAGTVHKGEYVVPKQHVDQSTGMPTASFLAQIQNGMRSFSMANPSNGGSASDGTMMVELSPYDRKLLANAGNVQLKLNGKIVAEATNSNNLSDARRGSN